MRNLIDYAEYSNLWSGFVKIHNGLEDVVTAINKLTEAVNHQTEKYELLMRELSEEKGKRK